MIIPLQYKADFSPLGASDIHNKLEVGGLFHLTDQWFLLWMTITLAQSFSGDSKCYCHWP